MTDLDRLADPGFDPAALASDRDLLDAAVRILRGRLGQRQITEFCYIADVAVDGAIIRAFIESKSPTDDELRAFVLAEIEPDAEAIVQMARDHHRRGAGPWEE